MGANRIIYLDITKGVAIYLVCLGHTYPSYNHVIYSFHMPLFMLMSGYFSGHALNSPFLPFIKKKAMNLLVPSLTVGLFSFLIHTLFSGYSISFLILEMYGGAWFLKCLFLCFVVVWLFLKILKNKWLSIVISSVIVFIIPYCHTFNLNYLLLFFWTGYLLKETDFLSRINEIYLIVIPLLLYSLYFYLNIVRAYQVIYPSTLFHDPLLLPVQYIVGLTGSLFVIGLCKSIGKISIVSNWMKNIGQYTLGIYIVQILLLERLLHYAFLESCQKDSYLSNYFFCPLIALFVTVVCYHVILYLKKNRIINILLFGGVYKYNS